MTFSSLANFCVIFILCLSRASYFSNSPSPSPLPSMSRWLYVLLQARRTLFFLLLIFGSCTAQIPTDTDRHNASVWATVCTYCPYCPSVRLSVCPLLSLPQCSEFGRTPKFWPGQHVTDLLEWDGFLGLRDVGRHFHLLMRPGSFPALLRPQNVSIKYWKHFSGPGAAQFMTVAVGPQWRGQKELFWQILQRPTRLIGFLATKPHWTATNLFLFTEINPTCNLLPCYLWFWHRVLKNMVFAAARPRDYIKELGMNLFKCW